MIDRIFLFQALIAILVVGGLGGFMLMRDAPGEVILGSVTGLIMSTLNAITGSLCIGYAFDKPQNTFLRIVFGGMVLRMGILLVGLFVLIRIFQVHAFSLALSLFGFYLIFLVMEILSIQRRAEAMERTAQ